MSKIRTRKSGTVAAIGIFPAAAVLMLTPPGAAHAAGWPGQGQYGDQSNSTEQNSSADSRAVQVAPAANVNVGGGDQSIYQANRNGSQASSGNSNVTGQDQAQNQGGVAGPARLSAPVHRAHTLPLPIGQGQGGDQSNATRQNSGARSDARQDAPAYNVGGAAQHILQGNGNASDALSGNGNLTGQDQAQNQD